MPRAWRRAVETAVAPAAALLFAGCAELMPPPVPGESASAPPAAGAPAGESEAAMERRVHDLVSRHRASRGLPPLAYDERLAEIARRHSAEMARGRRALGHEGFDERADEVGRLFAVRSMAENVAYDGRPDAAARTVESWLSSPGHRRNIEGTFAVTGVGIARAADGTYHFTQVFAARR